MIAASVSAFAEGYTVTINANPQDKGTHTYGAYQIFKGNLDATTGVIGDIEWGSGISEAGKAALGDAVDYAKSITEANKAAKAAELAQYLTTAEKTGSDKIEGLEGGYYLIKDENDPTGNDPKAVTKFILQVLKDEQVTVKSSVPTVEKKVQEKNDTTDEIAWQDAADYDIGDTIPYQVTSTIGSGIANFDKYSFQFVDTMSKGLTLNQTNWDIKVGEESIKSLFTLTSAEGADGATIWTWAATDIKSKISDGTQVVLTYEAELNDEAVYTVDGNSNTVVVKYDNNPNSSGNGTPGGTTPEDKVTVFTYKIVANKVNEALQPLPGAEFTLSKKVGDEWEEVEVINGQTTFTFKGQDAGVYKLEETGVPAGYNKAEDIYFLVEGTYASEADEPKLTALEVYASDENGTKGALLSTEETNATFTATYTDSTASTNVVNKKGVELPSTGGMGTTILYIAGSVLVLAAAILLVTKRRMGAED